ncbi:MAG TPA: AraC family transcriptional regulator, partial [Corynebacterium sp.]|nr:AraC family transcriptional regulator [Corynebacterium sp.]
ADPNAVAVAQEKLLGLLHRALTSSNSSAAGLVAAARDVIERSYSNPGLTVSEIAAAVGISERQLARAFAEQGTTVAAQVRSRRVELAQSVLIDPRYRGMSMAEIAARCGFSSQSSFSRAFREEAGLSPLQWRKSRG